MWFQSRSDALAKKMLRPLLLSLLMVAAAAFGSTQDANYTSKEGCESILTDPSQCECLDHRIKCGLAILRSERHLSEISCSTYDARALEYFPSLKVGNITKLILSHCAFPSAAVMRERLAHLGIKNYTELLVENIFEKNDNHSVLLQQRFANMPAFTKLRLLNFKIPLPANYLENCTELTDLTLRGSSDLPGTLLHPLGQLTKLDIMVRNMANVASKIFSKQTKLQTLTLDCSLKNSSVEMSTLTSQELWHMPDLHQFELHSCGDNVPTELFWKSENLVFIGIESNISYVGRDFLKAQKNLLTLQLSRNNIARLPDDLFRNTIRLRHIMLAHNNLERIQSGLFDSIENLYILNLEHNPITTVSPDVFNKLSNARIYLGALYSQHSKADWAKSTKATLCEEEFKYGVCIYCKREEYLDHFADRENCNKQTEKLENVLLQKLNINRWNRTRTTSKKQKSAKLVKSEKAAAKSKATQ
ncbi:protein toll [Scaptodrosophila lebanonensis]|uniref:Protein toll n=1 Tax=Drosophila lebanonensis TaxID=7225 RepID=A0A6J2U8H6_DROLE|nr:protein toll [Scaptodrosophila lebanonensis]